MASPIRSRLPAQYCQLPPIRPRATARQRKRASRAYRLGHTVPRFWAFLSWLVLHRPTEAKESGCRLFPRFVRDRHVFHSSVVRRKEYLFGRADCANWIDGYLHHKRIHHFELEYADSRSGQLRHGQLHHLPERCEDRCKQQHSFRLPVYPHRPYTFSVAASDNAGMGSQSAGLQVTTQSGATPAGDYTVTITGTDANGLSNSTQVTLTVN
jgi:hypothetical protein